MNLILCIINRNLLRQAHDRMLRRRVTRRPSQRHQARNARHVDDPASGGVASAIGGERILLEELGDGVLAAEEDAAGVDAEGAVKGLG